MSSTIFFPPKVYLDTNHLIHIARIRNGQSIGDAEKYRKDYVFINQCIKDGRCIIIFNPYASLEWVEGRATEESASQIADIYDEAKCIYQSVDDTFIYVWEILQQCRQIDSSISFPEFEILCYLQNKGSYTSVHAIIAENVIDYDWKGSDRSSFSSQVPVVSIREHVIATFRWKNRKPEIYKERVDGFNDAIYRDIQNAEEKFQCLSKKQMIDWMKRYLQIDKVLKAKNPAIDIDSVLKKIDISKCPAIYIYKRIREAFIKEKRTPDQNDCDDFVYLPVIPYTEISLIEKKLRERIIQASSSLNSKVFYKPSDAANALKYMNRWG